MALGVLAGSGLAASGLWALRPSLRRRARPASFLPDAPALVIAAGRCGDCVALGAELAAALTPQGATLDILYLGHEAACANAADTRSAWALLPARQAPQMHWLGATEAPAVLRQVSACLAAQPEGALIVVPAAEATGAAPRRIRALTLAALAGLDRPDLTVLEPAPRATAPEGGRHPLRARHRRGAEAPAGRVVADGALASVRLAMLDRIPAHGPAWSRGEDDAPALYRPLAEPAASRGLGHRRSPMSPSWPGCRP